MPLLCSVKFQKSYVSLSLCVHFQQVALKVNLLVAVARIISMALCVYLVTVTLLVAWDHVIQCQEHVTAKGE